MLCSINNIEFWCDLDVARHAPGIAVLELCNMLRITVASTLRPTIENLRFAGVEALS